MHRLLTQMHKKLMADLFLVHFVSIYQPLPLELPQLGTEQDGLFDYGLFLIQDHHIYDMLLKLPAKHNTTLDGIPSIFLKKCAASLAYPLANLFRRSFLYGVVPKAWKDSLIIPLFKTGNASSPNNYRPICLTSSIAKLAEKLVYEDIKGFTETLGIIPTSQHGFQDKKSVTSLLLETTDQ
jgi:hypothetical protein